MTNKYQESLDRLFQYYVLRDDNEFCENYHRQEEDIETLQELIDNYIELVNEKCKKCGDFNIITKIEPLTILCKEKGCKWYGK